MKLLVTGGAGYIGSQTVRELLGKGYQVVVLDNLSTGFSESVPTAACFVKADLRDSQALQNLFKEHQFEAVMHFAAKSSVPESVLQPDEYRSNNVDGFIALLEAMPSSVRSIIFSSSAAVYGNSQAGQLVKENGPVQPMNPYGETKLRCEELLREFCQKNAVSGVALRYFNVAGAGVDGSNGQRSRHGNTLIKIAAEVAAGHRSEMQIHGADYPTQDGTCIRDFIHVEDLAELHASALQWSLKNSGFEIFNCGYGHGSSVREVIRAMKKVSGVDFKVLEGPRREGDPTEVVADVSKMKAAFGWSPRYDDLEFICRSAYEWEKKL